MRYLLAAICLLRAWRDASSATVTGYEGSGVSIRCNYSKEHEGNSKYLCNDSTPAPLTACKDLIKTDKKNEWVTEGRFSLFDDPRAGFFTVNITGLQLADTGTYRCAVDKNLWPDSYTEVSLKVLKDSTKNTQPTAATSERKGTTDTASPPTVTLTTPAITVTASAEPPGARRQKTALSATLLSITVGLTVLLLFGLVLLIIYRQKRKKPAASKHRLVRTDTDSRHPDSIQCSSEYEEVKEQIPIVPSLYCTVDLPENASPMIIYSTVSPPKASCSESVNYTTVIFTENPACAEDSTVNFTRDSEYATVNL